METPTTTNETVNVTIPVYSEALNETVTLCIPVHFEAPLADIVADQRTVYGANFSRPIVELLFDISRAARWGEHETADRLVDYAMLKQRELVISGSRRMQEEAR